MVFKFPKSGQFQKRFGYGSVSKESTCNVGELGWEDPLEEGMAAHYSVLAWRIPWTEEPGGLQSVGSQSPTRPVTPHSTATEQVLQWFATLMF